MTGLHFANWKMIHVGMIFTDIYRKKTHTFCESYPQQNIKFLAGEWTNFTVTKD